MYTVGSLSSLETRVKSPTANSICSEWRWDLARRNRSSAEFGAVVRVSDKCWMAGSKDADLNKYLAFSALSWVSKTVWCYIYQSWVSMVRIRWKLRGTQEWIWLTNQSSRILIILSEFKILLEILLGFFKVPFLQIYFPSLDISAFEVWAQLDNPGKIRDSLRVTSEWKLQGRSLVQSNIVSRIFDCLM